MPNHVGLAVVGQISYAGDGHGGIRQRLNVQLIGERASVHSPDEIVARSLVLDENVWIAVAVGIAESVYFVRRPQRAEADIAAAGDVHSEVGAVSPQHVDF